MKTFIDTKAIKLRKIEVYTQNPETFKCNVLTESYNSSTSIDKILKGLSACISHDVVLEDLTTSFHKDKELLTIVYAFLDDFKLPIMKISLQHVVEEV